MAGRDYIGNSTDGKLSVLDLSEAKIWQFGKPLEVTPLCVIA